MHRHTFAKKQFLEIYQRSPWLAEKNRQKPQWPLVEFYLKEQRISYLECDLAQRLLKPYPSVGQETALFLCHLTLAAKAGHLRIEVGENTLDPTVDCLWRNEEGKILGEKEGRHLTRLIMEGSQNLPQALLTEVDRNVEKESLNTPICRFGKDFYLQRYWIYETLFIKNLEKHLKSSPTLVLNLSEIEKTVRDMCHNQQLLDQQAQVILQGCSNPLLLVPGGPGTGKTYTAGYLIKVFWQHLSKHQRSTCQIVLTAPTGKATANLQRSLSKILSLEQNLNPLEDFPPIQSKTLHALLRLKEMTAVSHASLSADLIIVDESSMIDMRMMAALFQALKSGSRLILLGDKDQLPSVEAGSVFRDLIQGQKTYSIPCVPLSHCLRMETQELIDFSQQINQGAAHKVLNILNRSQGGMIKRLDFKEGSKERWHPPEGLIEYILPFFTTAIKDQSPGDLLEFFQKIRMLSPLRKGHLGVELINQAIWAKLFQSLSKSKPQTIAIPIIILTNDYHQELFNGETGVLIHHLGSHGVKDYAFFHSRNGENQIRNIAAAFLPPHELAYCLSVHKSQGSEFDHVILLLPEGSEFFGREIFYTAATRARKRLEIFGSDEVIQKTVASRKDRLSGFREC